MKMIAGHIAGVACKDLPGGMGKRIPDTWSAAAIVPTTLNLIRRRGGSPRKILWKLFHVSPSLSEAPAAIQADSMRNAAEPPNLFNVELRKTGIPYSSSSDLTSPCQMTGKFVRPGL